MNPVDWHALDAKDRLQLSLGAPATFFVTGDESIELAALNSATGVILTLAGRFVQLDGQSTPFVHTLTPASDRTLSSVTRSLGDGWIQNLTVYASSGSPGIGQCWARVRVLRGGGGATFALGTLVSGYVTAQQPIAFPGGQVRGTLDGPGYLRAFQGANPPANTEISETVQAGARWRVLSLTVILLTDATAGNRAVQIEYISGGFSVGVYQSPIVQPASQSYNYTYSREGADRGFNVAANIQSRLPDVVLPAGSIVRSSTSGMQATDNYGSPFLLIEEWLDGA